jgi:hypothetical protein
VIRTRLMADTAIRRMMTEMMDDMPAEHRQEMQDMLDRPARAELPPPAARPRGRAKPTPAKPAAAKPTPPKTTPAKPTPAKPEPAKPADPHAGHPPPRR